MAYHSNPFLGRVSEHATSDHEFVKMFSPKILERLPETAYEPAVHVFRSPPGCGKTTLLRALTPAALKAFWQARKLQEMSEAYQRLVVCQALDESRGPQVLGIFLSCASGYADLPPGLELAQDGPLRALLNCRIVLRAMRGLGCLLDHTSTDQLADVELQYPNGFSDLKAIPLAATAVELVRWAEAQERQVYADLDSFANRVAPGMPSHVRFEGLLWLQAVKFIAAGQEIAPRRMLMIDDLHKLRRRQRAVLLEEFVELRPTIPVWLAQRSIALGDDLLSQGGRSGRDVREYPIDDLWGSSKGNHQFVSFAQNVLDRRLVQQDSLERGSFAQLLRDVPLAHEIDAAIKAGAAKFKDDAKRYESRDRYSEWLSTANQKLTLGTIESLRDAYVTRILLARDSARRQLALDLGPLPPSEIDERDSSQVQAAAEIFMHEELGVPYYFGIDRLAILATNNVEELLALAAFLYDGLRARQVIRGADPVMSAADQERLLLSAAKAKRDFVPKNHTEGTRAQRLIDSIGAFCRSKTFLGNAPYAPGVTGVRLSSTELQRLSSTADSQKPFGGALKRVLTECIAENLLVTRSSAASTSRDSGVVLYLNRTLCALYGLPLQMGGWQDVTCGDLIDWTERGLKPSKRMEIQ